MRLANTTPAILRFESGQRIRGKLQVISLTGGLLCLTSPLNQGSRAQLMFLTDAGTVLGTAELLPSLSDTLQPFRFLAINDDHEQRLRDLIQLSLERNRLDQRSIVNDRAW
jgi:hypothetical protein